MENKKKAQYQGSEGPVYSKLETKVYDLRQIIIHFRQNPSVQDEIKYICHHSISEAASTVSR